ncbi:MAG: hypothetical protein ABFD83_13535 [Armatimonadota bacterium]
MPAIAMVLLVWEWPGSSLALVTKAYPTLCYTSKTTCPESRRTMPGKFQYITSNSI